MVPEAGLEPARTKSPRDFKSLVSTNSTTPAKNQIATERHKKNNFKKLELSEIYLT